MDEKSKYSGGPEGPQGRPVRYVLAVSGGVDSVVLLDILTQRIAAERLVVAHFDHGIREDSALDREFVAALARSHNVEFIYDEGRLGAGASEAAARDARYAFLRRARQYAKADYIVTAHHQDDLLETAVLNLLRGTGRRGLSSLRSHGDLYRPLLTTPRQHILEYARQHGLQWREDSTNANHDYLRNYIRHNIMPRFDDAARERLRQLIAETHGMNLAIDNALTEQLHMQYSLAGVGDRLDRQWFIMLPHVVAREIIAAWLRNLGIASFDRRLLERAVVAGKTFAPGKVMDINARYVLAVDKEYLMIRPR